MYCSNDAVDLLVFIGRTSNKLVGKDMSWQPAIDSEVSVMACSLHYVWLGKFYMEFLCALEDGIVSNFDGWVIESIV